MRKYILYVLFIVTYSNITAQSDWLKLEKDTYKIEYPSTWDLDESGQMGSSFLILSKQENNEDKFRENVNLIIQNLAGYNLSLDQYTQISVEQIKSAITNATIIESKRITGQNSEYHKLVYSGDQGQYKLRFTQHYWLINEKAYILTFTTEQNVFDKFKVIGEKILNSFVLKIQ